MSHAADQVFAAEQEQAMREFAVWHAGNVIKEALRNGEPFAREVVIELQQESAK